MLKLFRKNNGSISVFLVIILVPVLVVSALFVDASRISLASTVVDSSADLALNTAMSNFDHTLNRYYGLMASSQNMDEFYKTAQSYFATSITSQGIDTSDASTYANQLIDYVKGDTDIADFLQIKLADEGATTVSAVDGADLSNPVLLKREVVEFMKYRAPIDGVTELLKKINDNADSLKDSEENAELMKEKQQYYEDEGKVVSAGRAVYNNMQTYNNLNITKEWVEQLKNDVTTYKERYHNNIHIPIVKDLYNTDSIGTTAFTRPTINTNLTNTTYTGNSPATAGNVKNFINNTCSAIEKYGQAKAKLESISNFINYNRDTMYPVQYYREMLTLVNEENKYSNYVAAAKSVFENFAQLKNAVESIQAMPDQSANILGETYIIQSYPHVNAAGENTLDGHYQSLKDQIEGTEGIANKDISASSVDSVYNSLTSILVEVSSSAIQVRNESLSSVPQEIASIYNGLNAYYSKIKSAEEALSKTRESLNSLKSAVETANGSLETWSGSANSSSTEIGKQHQVEINGGENYNGVSKGEEINKYTTVEYVQKMLDRINNISSLLGSLRSGIENYKYNETKIVEIDSLQKAKDASGVDASQISYMLDELNNYAESSFKFSESQDLQNVGITDNNNPAFTTVNTPEIYSEWMDITFSIEQPKETEMNNKYENKKQEDDKYTSEAEATAKGGAGSNNELNSIGSCEGQVKTKFGGELADMASFTSNLFSDFSGTVSGTATNVRDDLYTVDYIMSMFSYDTYENEGKYDLLEESGGNVNTKPELIDYSSVNEKWKSTEVTDSYNKTLRNDLINTANNWSYGNEVEYILYGGSNEKNKFTAYSNIFMMRYLLNMPADFAKYWNDGGLESIANAVAAATYGIVPAPLFKLVIIMGLVAAESAKDLQYLKKGMPVTFLKNKDQLYVAWNADTEGIVPSENVEHGVTFRYSDYIKLFLFLDLLNNAKGNNIYVRMGHAIQANMANSEAQRESGFVLSNAKVYFQIDTSATVSPLLLKLPIAEDLVTLDDETSKYTIHKKAIRGY